MRWKLVLIFSGILVLLGALAHVVMAARLHDSRERASEARAQVRRALHTARLQWQSDAVARERWLEGVVGAASVRAVFDAGTPSARAEAATAEANRLIDVCTRSELGPQSPSLLVFVDADGLVIGRNNVALMRGDPVAQLYPSLEEALVGGKTGGGIWVDTKRQEQLFVTYVPIADLTGERSLGAVVLGVPINDEALARTSELTSGGALVVLAHDASTTSVLARHGAVFEGAQLSALDDLASRTEQAGAVLVLDDAVSGYRVAAETLQKGVVLTTFVSAADEVAALPLTGLWGIVLLGIVMVTVAAFLLGDYISRPIEELEDGLLQVMNGDTELRFDLEHDVLGGLVSRINSMLDSLTGVQQSSPPPLLEEEIVADRPA